MDLQVLSEQVETVSWHYASRHGFRRDDAWFLLKLHEEVGELTEAFLARSGQTRLKGRSEADLDAGLAAELADVLAHTLLLARRLDVDLPAALEQKWLVRLPDARGAHAAFVADGGGQREANAS